MVTSPEAVEAFTRPVVPVSEADRFAFDPGTPS
jgi:hypothetical protein